MPTIKTLSCVLILSVGSGATASAQSGSAAPAVYAARSEPSPGAPGASTSLASAAASEAGRLVVAETRASRVNRARTRARDDAEGTAIALGVTAGAMVGFGVAGHYCHCESDKGILIGAAVGGVGGWLLFRALTK